MKYQAKQWLALGLIAAVIFSRLLPHVPNFTPVFSIAIFSGIIFSNRWLAILVSIAGLFLSNAVIGHTGSSFVTIIFVALTSFWGRKKHTHEQSWVTLSTVNPVLFFVLSNFFVWYRSGMYSLNYEGLVNCYLMALPFLPPLIFSTLLYSAVLFKAMALLHSRKTIPAINR